MIFLSASTGSLGSTVGIKDLPTSEYKTNKARVNSFPALDGQTVVVHSGTTILDSELKVVANISKALEDKLWSLFYGFTAFIMVQGISCYRVSIKSLKTNAGRLLMKLIIISDELET